MRADLVGSSCDQSDRKKGIALISRRGHVFGHNGGAVGKLPCRYGYLVCLGILFQEAGDHLPFLYLAGHDALIIFMEAPVFKYRRHDLQAGQGFPCNHKTAGIPVQPVADCRTEGS